VSALISLSAARDTTKALHVRPSGRGAEIAPFALAVPFAASIVGVFAVSTLLNTITIFLSTLVTTAVVLADGILVLRHRPFLGRFILGFGLLFWFWVEAATICFTTPQFANFHATYPYFGETLPPDLIGLGVFCINLFAIFAYAGWWVIPPPRHFIRRISSRNDMRVGILGDFVLFGAACLYWVPIFVAFGGSVDTALDVLLEMRSSERGAETSAGLLLHLQWIGVFAGAASLVRLLVGARGSRIFQFAAVGVIIPAGFLSSTRFYLIFLVLPALLVLVHPPGAGRRVSGSKTVGFALGLALAVAILVQGAIRSTGGLAVFLSEETGRSLLGEGLEHGFIGNEQFSATLVAMDVLERRGEAFHELLLPFFVTHFVPRQFWPNKPESELWNYFNFVVTNGRLTFNVTPSIVGQFYLNWGLWGVPIAGLILSWLARIGDYWWSSIDSKRQLMSTAVCGLWLAFVFLSFRHLSPLYIQFPVFGLILYWLTTRRARRPRALSRRSP
jgi:oligosaccharide repeat unit polymerase